jgi:O-antigen/teichoic acid export membrane protein
MSLAQKLKRFGGSFAGKSVVSLLVKVFGAFATYVFLLLFAQAMGPIEFGIFAFVLSAANFMMLAAGLGQPMMVLRSLSFSAAQDPGNATAQNAAMGDILRKGLRITGIGALFGVTGLMLFGLIAPLFGAPGTVWVYLGGAGLLVALLWAEFLSHLLRAFGAVAMALLPRDLLWRVVASLVALVGIALVIPLPAGAGLWLNAVILGGLVLAQFLYAIRLIPQDVQAAARTAAGATDAEWRRGSANFWGIAIAAGLAQHLTVVAVGFTLPPEEIGAFFAAFRTASLLSMPLTAANIVLAPMIARHYKSGQKDQIQKVITQFILMVSVPVALGLGMLVLYGDWVLALFDPAYRSAYLPLIIFGCGFLFNTITGPCGYVMMMTGAEQIYLRYTVLANLAAVIGAGIAIWFGMPWAATAIALASACQNIVASLWVYRNTGINPTILCLWQKP